MFHDETGSNLSAAGSATPGGGGPPSPAPSNPGLARTPSSSARKPALARSPSLLRSPSLTRTPSSLKADRSRRTAAMAQYLGMLQARFDFVAYVASNSGTTVSSEQVEAVWSTFVAEPVCPEERDLVFQWFSAACDRIGTRGATPVFADDATANLFSNRIANAGVVTQGDGEDAAAAARRRNPVVCMMIESDAGFECLRKLFLHANASQGKIKVLLPAEEAPDAVRLHRPFRSALRALARAMAGGAQDEAEEEAKKKPRDGFETYEVLDFDLVGLEIVWRVVVDAQSDQVAGKAVALLKQLLDKLAPAMAGNVEEYVLWAAGLCHAVQHMPLTVVVAPRAPGIGAGTSRCA